MRSTPRLIMLALLLVLSLTVSGTYNVQAGGACPVTGNPTGSITAGDATQTDRIFRDGLPSDCNGKVYPGEFGSASSFHFDQQSFVNNSGAPVCVEITFSATTNMHSVAYLNSFNPANIAQNYLGDLGSVNTPNTPEGYSVAVPDGATLVIVTHEATADGGGDYSYSFNCIPFPPPLPTAPGQILFSEFRLSGPGNPAAGINGAIGTQRDEYLELYNNTDTDLSLGGFVLRAYDPNFFAPGDGADFIQDLPPGTVIPARGHLLIGDGAEYSLSGYALLDLDTSTLFNGDFFIDNEGFQLISPDGLIVFDSVGFTGSGGRLGEDVNYLEGTGLSRRTQTAPAVQYAYVRKLASGLPQDTNNNAADFTLVSVTAASFPLTAGGAAQSTLGAPGPENVGSPIQQNAVVKPSLTDPGVSAAAAPNRVRDATPGSGTTAFGTLLFRRKFTNNASEPVNVIRWRVVDITTLGGITAGQADLRVINSTSGDFTVSVSTGGTVPVKGTQLEAPPDQAIGGGLNSSIITITPATPIMPGASVNIELALGVAGTGTFRFFVNTEGDIGTLVIPNKAGGVVEKRATKGLDANRKQALPPRRPAVAPKPVKSVRPVTRVAKR